MKTNKKNKINKLKLTCFFCKYEIIKNNKSKKLVKFRGNMKPLCKFCNAKKT